MWRYLPWEILSQSTATALLYMNLEGIIQLILLYLIVREIKEKD